MASVQKDCFIAPYDLRDEYRMRDDRIKSLCKAIAVSTHISITSQVMPDGTAKFVMIGQKRTVIKAKRNIVGQFCKPKAKSKYLEAPKEKPIRSSQQALQLLTEKNQSKLLKEGNPYLLTENALKKHNLLTGASELREFSCADCDRFWWRVVPITKPVSTCRQCGVTYDCLPRDKEFGIGRYLCTNCEHSFTKKWCKATSTSRCPKCKSEVRAPYIHPELMYTHEKQKTSQPSQQLSSSKSFAATAASVTYQMSAAQLQTKQYQPQSMPWLYIPPSYVPLIQPPRTEPPDIPYEQKQHKKTPSFKPKKVIYASTVHESTGSTISTILTQKLDARYEFMSVSDSDSDDSDEEYPATSETDDASSVTDTTDVESSDTEALVGSDSESEHEYGHHKTRRRVLATDSESDFDTDDQDSIKKSSISAGSDSGIGSASASKSGSHKSTSSTLGSYAGVVRGHINPLRTIEVKNEFPGVAFSKFSAQQTVDRKGATITGEGVKLFIPEGAVPSTDKVDILLQSCLGGPFVLPDDYVFASPVFLFSPPFAFHREVVLTIEHFACLDTDEDCNEIAFFTSKTKPTISKNEPYWYFHQYGEPKFQRRSRFGTIHLRHFCFGGFGWRGRKNWYCISLYQPVKFSLNPCHAIFSVTLHHEVFTKNLEQYLKQNFENERFHPKHNIFPSGVLETDVTLKIPSIDLGYEIVPETDPCTIPREQIDYPRKHKKRAMSDIAVYPPRITLRINFKRDLPALKCPLEVEGIKKSLKFILLVNPTTDSDYSSQSSIESNSCEENRADEVMLSHKDHFTIADYLTQMDPGQIVRLGGALGLYYSTLLNMKRVPDDMVAAWLRKEDNTTGIGPPSWTVLAKALRKIGQAGIAETIENKQL